MLRSPTTILLGTHSPTARNALAEDKYGTIGSALTDRSKGDIGNLGFFYCGQFFLRIFITREVPHSLLARTVYE